MLRRSPALPVALLTASTWFVATLGRAQPSASGPGGSSTASASASVTASAPPVGASAPPTTPVASAAPAVASGNAAPPSVASAPTTAATTQAPATPEADAAAAAPPAADADPYIPVHAERRSGVVIGLVGGLALSNASGTPIKLSRRATPVDTGIAPGFSASGYIGGVFTDWFSFHVGGTFSQATKGENKTTGGGVLFGVETWPLFSWGGIYRDLGVGLDFGTGGAVVSPRDNPNTELADGGGYSMIRASVFRDMTSVWRINLGPVASYEYRSTSVFTEHLVTLGLRTALYTGP